MSTLRIPLNLSTNLGKDDILTKKRITTNNDDDGMGADDEGEEDNDEDDDDGENGDDDGENGDEDIEENEEDDEDEDGDGDDDGDDDDDGDGENVEKLSYRKEHDNVELNPAQQYLNLLDNDDSDYEQCNKKFDEETNFNFIKNVHPECTVHNYDEVLKMAVVTRDKNNIIIDSLHRTCPFITKYEKAKIIGQRTKQINSGATIFVTIPEYDIPLDGYNIALMEYDQGKIPFIIRRPLPNGGWEYWRISDFEIIN